MYVNIKNKRYSSQEGAFFYPDLYFYIIGYNSTTMTRNIVRRFMVTRETISFLVLLLVGFRIVIGFNFVGNKRFSNAIEVLQCEPFKDLSMSEKESILMNSTRNTSQPLVVNVSGHSENLAYWYTPDGIRETNRLIHNCPKLL